MRKPHVLHGSIGLPDVASIAKNMLSLIKSFILIESSSLLLLIVYYLNDSFCDFMHAGNCPHDL